MIYSVVLNSNERVSGTVTNAIYSYDWSIFPANKKMKVTSLFNSGLVNLSASAPIALLEIQLGQSHNYKVINSGTKSMTSNIVGYLQSNTNTSVTYLHGDNNSLFPIYLDSRPLQNDFYVRIINNASTPIAWTDGVSGILEYSIILSFEILDD